MKKILSLITITMMILLMPISNVKANDNTTEIGYKIFQVNPENEVEPSESIQMLANELEMDVMCFKKEESIQTLPNILNNTYEQNKEIKKYEIDTYFIEKNNNIQPRATNTKTDYQWIVASSAKVTLTIYFDTYISGGFEYGKLIRAAGSVSDYRSGFKFKKANVVLGSIGIDYTDQTKTYTTTNESWSYNAPSSWGYNLMNNGLCSIGTNVTVYITRDGNTLYDGNVVLTVS